MSKIEQEEDFAQDLESQIFASTSDTGQIDIANDVMARIVEIAVSEVEGVALHKEGFFSDLLNRKDKEQSKPIVIEKDAASNSVKVGLSVKMEYGHDMYELAMHLRKHIKATVEKMTRVSVQRVDIKIMGILTKDRERPAQNAEEQSEQD